MKSRAPCSDCAVQCSSTFNLEALLPGSIIEKYCNAAPLGNGVAATKKHGCEACSFIRLFVRSFIHRWPPEKAKRADRYV